MLKIDKGIFYFNNHLYSKAAYYLSEGLINTDSEVSLEYLLNINFNDSTSINKLISSFEYMSLNDTTNNASYFYLAILEMKKEDFSKTKKKFHSSGKKLQVFICLPLKARNFSYLMF